MANSLALAFNPVLHRLMYNGVEMANGSLKTERFFIKPVEDASGRTFTHHEIELEVSFHLHPLTQGEKTVNDAMSSLTQPAAGFVLTGHGFGNFNMNFGAVRDVRWGPKPMYCEVENAGAGNHVVIHWGCRFATLTCGDAVFSGAFPLEFCWKVSFDIDRSGLTTRTISGFVSVPATRFNADIRKLPITADVMRERINPPGIVGFRRIPGVFDFDFAKTRCDFTVKDEEFPSGNIPPAGVIDGTFSHNVAQEPGKPSIWNGNIEATYEIARGFTVQNAVESFFGAVRDRWETTRKGRFAGLGPAGAFALGLVAPPPVIRPWQFIAGEPNAYGKQTIKLGMVYRVYRADIATILGASGLWRAIPGSNWKQWASSLAFHMGPRGVSGLVMSPGDDKIVDLCRPDAPLIDLVSKPMLAELRAGAGGAFLKGGKKPPEAVLKNFFGGTGSGINFLGTQIEVTNALKKAAKALFPAPEPGNSFLDYVAGYHIETDSGVVVGSTLPTSPIEERANTTGRLDAIAGSLSGARESSFFPPATDVGTHPDTDGGSFSHQRTKPQLFVTLFGYAQRIGFPVPVPEIIEVGGSPVVPCNRVDMGEGFEQTTLGADAVGVPLFVARWRLRYALVDAPRTAMPTMATPFAGSAA